MLFFNDFELFYNTAQAKNLFLNPECTNTVKPCVFLPFCVALEQFVNKTVSYSLLFEVKHYKTTVFLTFLNSIITKTLVFLLVLRWPRNPGTRGWLAGVHNIRTEYQHTVSVSVNSISTQHQYKELVHSISTQHQYKVSVHSIST